MKTIVTIFVLALAIAALPIAAQTANPVASSAAKKTATGTPAAAPSQSARGCVKLPTLSPKIPALPAGLTCARSLYSITLPTANLTDISPMEDPNLRDALGIPLPTPFTLAYIDTKGGSGALIAPRKWYTIKYNGYLVDGTVFDSTDKHPEQGGKFVFQQGPQGPQSQRQVVTGMDTGLDGMRIGGKRRLFIPWQLAYGPNAYNSIPPKSELIFDIELISQDTIDPRTKPVSSTPDPTAAPKPVATPVAAPTAAPAPASAPTAAPAPATPPQPAAPKP